MRVRFGGFFFSFLVILPILSPPAGHSQFGIIPPNEPGMIWGGNGNRLGWSSGSWIETFGRASRIVDLVSVLVEWDLCPEPNIWQRGEEI